MKLMHTGNSDMDLSILMNNSFFLYDETTHTYSDFPSCWNEPGKNPGTHYTGTA
jgi:hypothetical protein